MLATEDIKGAAREFVALDEIERRQAASLKRCEGRRPPKGGGARCRCRRAGRVLAR
ncbi:MAG: hypothetical protein ACLT98_08295 [Eggerthellaceae bacterium]